MDRNGHVRHSRLATNQHHTHNRGRHHDANRTGRRGHPPAPTPTQPTIHDRFRVNTGLDRWTRLAQQPPKILAHSHSSSTAGNATPNARSDMREPDRAAPLVQHGDGCGHQGRRG